MLSWVLTLNTYSHPAPVLIGVRRCDSSCSSLATPHRYKILDKKELNDTETKCIELINRLKQ